jgi:hypothetical protein
LSIWLLLVGVVDLVALEALTLVALVVGQGDSVQEQGCQ